MLRPVTADAEVSHKSVTPEVIVPEVIRAETTVKAIVTPHYRTVTMLTTSSSLHRELPVLRSAASFSPAFRYTDFAKQLARKPGATGAIAPSSKSLAIEVVKQANLPCAEAVVELGPGTGVFTEQILKNLRDDQLFFALELNQSFVAATKSRCPTACVYHDAASALPYWLEKHGRQQVDCIISSLPWTILDEPDQNEIMSAISDSLALGGTFVSIVYLGARFRSRGRYFINKLRQHFSSVTNTPTIWQNLPPSQIYCCIK